MPFRTNAERKLQKIYDSLPKIDCQKKCAESCGPILMTNLEYERASKAAGFKPLFMNHKTMRCPMLDSVCGTCKIYESRPLICRIWALTPDMACPWGCVPERWLSKEECSEIIKKVEKLSRE